MKVPKSISISQDFLEWLERERPDFYRKFSENTETLLKNNLMDSGDSARDYEKKKTAKRLAELNAAISRAELEKKGLLIYMKSLESEKDE